MTRYDGRWFIVVSVFLFVLALGYVVDYVNPFGTFREQRQNGLNAVVLDGAEIVIHYLHGDGTVAKTDVLSASEELIGLSRADVGRIHPGWMIVGFSSDRMIVNKFCPEPAGKEGFLQVVDGH